MIYGSNTYKVKVSMRIPMFIGVGELILDKILVPYNLWHCIWGVFGGVTLNMEVRK